MKRERERERERDLETGVKKSLKAEMVGGAVAEKVAEVEAGSGGDEIKWVRSRLANRRKERLRNIQSYHSLSQLQTQRFLANDLCYLFSHVLLLLFC